MGCSWAAPIDGIDGASHRWRGLRLPDGRSRVPSLVFTETRAGVKPSVSINSRWQKLFLPRIDADGHDRLPKRLFSPALMPLPTHWTSLCEQQRPKWP